MSSFTACVRHSLSTAATNHPRLLCVAILGIGFLTFFNSLDRYPVFMVDEVFYNFPAVSYLEGDGFRYKHCAAAPHGDEIWAYNGPFFPRLQVATFRLFGKNVASSRAPQYVFAYLSVLVLCLFLISNERPIAAVLLAIAWNGDRATREILFGRPDGIVLFFITLAFIGLVRLIRRPTVGCGLIVGLCLGTAVGFHFVAGNFVMGTGLLLLVVLRGDDRWRALAGYVAGGLVPLLLILSCWWPHIPEALEQLRWHVFGFEPHVTLLGKSSYLQSVRELLALLSWSQYWALFLIFALLTILLPQAIRVFWRRRLESVAKRSLTSPSRANSTKKLDSESQATTSCTGLLARVPNEGDQSLIAAVACLYGVLGLMCVVSPRALYPQYLIYFSIWPMAVVAMKLESLPWPATARLWQGLATATIVLAWLPSLAWNGMRFRELILYRSALDHATLVRQLRQAVPARAVVAPIPQLVLAACEADLRVNPLPWWPEQTDPADACYLLIDKSEFESPRYVDPQSIARRPVCLKIHAFPNAGPLDYEIVLLGPAVDRHLAGIGQAALQSPHDGHARPRVPLSASK